MTRRNFSQRAPPSEETEEVQQPQLPPGLWVVATPIGNLNDLSFRAKEALLKAELEDTRRTSKLMYAIGATQFTAKLKRCDEYASQEKLAGFVREMRAGKSFALVSDSGTPCISDPGSQLISSCYEAKVRVTPVPGPSAITAIISISGFRSNEFTFRGFFPRGDKDRRLEIKAMQESATKLAAVAVWYESPQRIQSALSAVVEHVNPSCVVLVGKELTKLHEKVFRGLPAQVLRQVSSEIESEGEVGEWCFAIDFSVERPSDENAADVEFERSGKKALGCILACNVPASEATRQIVKAYEGASKNQIYEAALKMSNKK